MEVKCQQWKREPTFPSEGQCHAMPINKQSKTKPTKPVTDRYMLRLFVRSLNQDKPKYA
jgi:hypothetical protein